MILITRDKSDVGLLESWLTEVHEPFVTLPMLSIEPMKCLENNLLNADIYIFISKPSVRFFIGNYGIFANKPCFAVGPSTANLLAKSKWVPRDALEPYNAQGILLQPELQQVLHKKIAIVCGQPYNNVLGNALTHRGGVVTYCPVYRRCGPKHYVIDELQKQKSVKIIIFASAAALNNFHDVAVANNLRHLFSCIWVVVSENIYNSAKRLGYGNKVVLAKNATNPELIAVLKGLLQK